MRDDLPETTDVIGVKREQPSRLMADWVEATQQLLRWQACKIVGVDKIVDCADMIDDLVEQTFHRVLKNRRFLSILDDESITVSEKQSRLWGIAVIAMKTARVDDHRKQMPRDPHTLWLLHKHITTKSRDVTETDQLEKLCHDEDLARHDEDLEHLRTCLTQLDKRSREIIALRYFNNMSSKEAADFMGMTDEALRAALSRAIQKLRGLFGLGTVSER